MRSDKQMKKRYIEIDTLKGFAIFLVVFGHSIIFFPINIKEIYPWCGYLYNFIYLFHMPLFFFISGFCFSYHQDYSVFMKKKNKRILIPYCLFCALDAMGRLVLSGYVNRPLDAENIVFRFFFYGGEYWFLYVLFEIFLIYPLIYSLYGKKRNMILVFVCLFLLINSPLATINTFRISDVVYHLVYFNAGCLLKLFFEQMRKYNLNIEQSLCTAIMTFVLLCFVAYVKTYYGLDRFGTVIVAFVGILFSWLLTKSVCFNRLFSRYGKYSLQLYLFNGFSLGISRFLICNIMQIQNPVVIIAFNVLVDFFGMYLMIKYIFEKSKILRIMMGA